MGHVESTDDRSGETVKHDIDPPEPLCIDGEPCLCRRLQAAKADECRRIVDLIYRECHHTKYVGVTPCIHDEIVHMIDAS